MSANSQLQTIFYEIAQIEAFVDHYNHQRYHESLNNLTPEAKKTKYSQSLTLTPAKLRELATQNGTSHHPIRVSRPLDQDRTWKSPLEAP